MPRYFYGLGPDPSHAHPLEQQDLRKRPNISTLLFSEGNDEFSLLNGLLNDLGADPQKVALMNLKGQGNITPKTISKLILEEFKPQIESYFILRDAEASTFANMVASTKNIASFFDFKASHFQSSRRPQFIDSKNRKFGFFISPDHKSQGAIDSLFLNSMASENSINCLDPFFACVLSGGPALNQVHLAKRKFRAYLVASKGVLGIGAALNNGAINLKHQAFDDLRESVKSILP